MVGVKPQGSGGAKSTLKSFRFRIPIIIDQCENTEQWFCSCLQMFSIFWKLHFNGMQIKVSSAVANDFNQLIYTLGALPCPVLEIKGSSDHSRRDNDILARPKNWEPKNKVAMIEIYLFLAVLLSLVGGLGHPAPEFLTCPAPWKRTFPVHQWCGRQRQR